jgi:hypothetical protein
VAIMSICAMTPVGVAAWTVILVGAAAGGLWGVVRSRRYVNAHDVLADPESWQEPLVVGAVVAVQLYRISPDGPYINWP